PPRDIPLNIEAEYTKWLVEVLGRERARNQELTERVHDLEGRGPLGVLKARIGLWLIARQ
ncbi:MAG TPA: hypothetical protein VN108_06225, partial [Marmoricola sp.]|nr:hypothetical protein [Marmoricola sp.]